MPDESASVVIGGSVAPGFEPVREAFAANFRFAAREVVLGRIGRTKSEIVSGLAAGNPVADERSFLVKAELTKGTAEHHH